MGNDRQMLAVLAAVALLGALAVGCGSSDSSISSGSSTAVESDSSADSSNSSSAGAIAEFGKNQLTTFGKEASDAEREAASKVLEENMEARAAGYWAEQCSSLSAAAIEQVEQSAAARGTEGNCAQSLEAQAKPISESKAIRANTMTGPIAALRVEGTQGFALYHGTAGVDYVMPMVKEGGEWKVAALATEEVR